VDSGDPQKGPDGAPCTDDDPTPRSTVRGRAHVPRIRGGGFGLSEFSFLPPHIQVRLTTGTARAEILDAGNVLGQTVPAGSLNCGSNPCRTEVTGTPFACPALAVNPAGSPPGAALAGAFTTLDNAAFGDTVTMLVLGLGAAPFCAGDCDQNGLVTVAELVTLVNIGLGEATPAACPNGVPDGAAVDIALVIQAVESGLHGCGG
jgi:hypothetical protein